MRLFIAIEISDQVKNQILKITDRLKLIKGVRVVKQQNIHLTLLFLGDIKDVQGVVNKLKNIKFSPFEVIVEGAGFFPNNKNIKVAWVGIRKNIQLEYLQKKISLILNKRERYVPHLTVARTGFVSEVDKQKLKEIMAVQRETLSFRVDKFRLYNSDLTPFGPVHRVIESFEATE